MASVTYDNSKKYRYLGQEEEEAPEKSEGGILRQRILKELLKKQLTKQTSLEDHLHNQKEFVKATPEESVTGSTSGLVSFQQFRGVELDISVKQTLKSCGLTDSEIQFLFDDKSQSSHLEAPYARRKRLEAIQEKLTIGTEEQTVLHQNSKKVPHATLEDAIEENIFEVEDEEAYILQAPEKASISDPLIYQKKEEIGEAKYQSHFHDVLPADHPMNHIKELAEQLFTTHDKNQNGIDEHYTRKRCHETSTAKRHKNDDSKCVYFSEKPKTFWDMQQIPKVVTGNTPKMLSGPFPLPCKEYSNKIKQEVLRVTKKKNEIKLDHTKPFILSLPPEDLIPLSTIEANKKSIQELKEMEKFKNYSEGLPSCTLYIKNLSPCVSARDLAVLMGHFESANSPKILYRIMGGRMKGQAFVTFADIASASAALKMCNGYVMHGRPLVAQFGKRT